MRSACRRFRITLSQPPPQALFRSQTVAPARGRQMMRLRGLPPARQVQAEPRLQPELLSRSLARRPQPRTSLAKAASKRSHTRVDRPKQPLRIEKPRAHPLRCGLSQTRRSQVTLTLSLPRQTHSLHCRQSRSNRLYLQLQGRSRTPLHPTRKLQEIHPNNVAVSYTSREQIEVYRFGLPVAMVVPLVAIFLQAFLPRWLPFFSTYFDLPLLVVIFFAMARRSQVAGLLTGATIGLIQDALTQYPLGVNGIAKTVVGYGASSLGVKLDVESVGTRLLVTTGFYVVHQVIYFTIARGLVGLNLHWSWQRELPAGLANAILGVFLFALMDRLKQRA